MKRAASWLAALTWLVWGSAIWADERIGPELLLDQSTYLWGPPRVVSDGLGSIVVWGGGYNPYTIYSAHIDSAGTVTGPFVVAAGPALKRQPMIASDGRTALVVWSDFTSDRVSGIKAARLDPTGTPIDAVPITLDSRKLGTYGSMYDASVDFDGALFRAVWLRSNGRHQIYTRRVGSDGTVSARPLKVKARNMARLPFEPKVGCRRAGECLVTWLQTAGLDAVEGVRAAGDAILDREVRRFLENARDYQIRSNGTEYMIIGTRFDGSGCTPDGCPQNVVAGRVSAAGVGLDPTGVLVDNPPPGGLAYTFDVGLTFDGTNYLATFRNYTPPCGANLYAARITPGGTVLNPDIPGSLLVENSTAGTAAIAATRTDAVAVWQDLRPTTCGTFTEYPSVYARRAMAHPDASGSPLVEIGAIGALSVAEQTTLRLTLAASSLNPATTVFSAGNLPPGAVFDAAAQAFQWKPDPNDAGVYAAVHFEATDGVQTVSEDVTITATESSPAICGIAERLNVPVPGLAVQLKGKITKPRVTIADAAGRFCFFYTIQDEYVLTVAKPSRKQYSGDPLLIIKQGADLHDIVFTVRRIS